MTYQIWPACFASGSVQHQIGFACLYSDINWSTLMGSWKPKNSSSILSISISRTLFNPFKYDWICSSQKNQSEFIINIIPLVLLFKESTRRTSDSERFGGRAIFLLFTVSLPCFISFKISLDSETAEGLFAGSLVSTLRIESPTNLEMGYKD